MEDSKLKHSEPYKIITIGNYILPFFKNIIYNIILPAISLLFRKLYDGRKQSVELESILHICNIECPLGTYEILFYGQWKVRDEVTKLFLF